MCFSDPMAHPVFSCFPGNVREFLESRTKRTSGPHTHCLKSQNAPFLLDSNLAGYTQILETFHPIIVLLGIYSEERTQNMEKASSLGTISETV